MHPDDSIPLHDESPNEPDGPVTHFWLTDDDDAPSARALLFAAIRQCEHGRPITARAYIKAALDKLIEQRALS